ncbi:MAG: ABC transporter permease [Vicinamibacterales bacterium]
MCSVATIAFVLAHAAPGDPAELFFERAYGRPPTDEEVVMLQERMGLNRPLLLQYTSFMGGLPRGDLGRSWATGQSVTAALAGSVPATVALALSALVVAIVIGAPLGVAAAYQPGAALDQISRALAVAGASVPAFVLGYVFILVFSVKLRLLPVFGAGSPSHLVLPAVTLAFATAATYARLVRASVLETLGEEYIRAALAKGLTHRAVLVRHALPNAVLPLLTMVAISLGHLLGGAVIVEWVFSWPGLGRLAVEAIYARDYPLVQGVMLFGGAVFGVVSLAADVMYCWVDPRVRHVAGSS